jgi:ABC-type glutathione transport system ATPase component
MGTKFLSAREAELVRDKIRAEVGERPPTIGVVGVSGVGKSSTINTLLGATLPTSDTVACTWEFWSSDAELTFSTGQARGLSTHPQIVDADRHGRQGLAELRRPAEDAPGLTLIRTR